jgi:AraC family transcriptional regulator of adaptative response/methylated-DNA-[protein]-cysteine methyltransferase
MRVPLLQCALPEDIARQGKTLVISCHYPSFSFGKVFLATCARGLCFLGFPKTMEEGIQELRQHFPHATLEHTSSPLMEEVLSLLNGDQVRTPLPLFLVGTSFQQQVWKALCTLPPGSTCTYSHLATLIQRPSAVRAVATAVGRNPVSYLIPCHRVVRADGTGGEYRWGRAWKHLLLDQEQGV